MSDVSDIFTSDNLEKEESTIGLKDINEYAKRAIIPCLSILFLGLKEMPIHISLIIQHMMITISILKLVSSNLTKHFIKLFDFIYYAIPPPQYSLPHHPQGYLYSKGF